MVARSTKSGSSSPYYNVHVELDNKALKAKNTGLTQTVAKLQQENADLLKELNILRGESFEINSRYNNLKNVVSIIDSTTKTCLPKLTEVVETFTGIIQLCSVASNISNINKDTRTQAVKPHIVNGHVLHNPTITLSRLEGNDESFTPPRSINIRNCSNVTVRPSTSRSTSDASNDRHTNIDDNQGDSDSENEQGNIQNEAEEHDVSLRSQANRGVCSRRQTFIDDESRFQDDDSDNSDEELEAPVEEEEDNEDDESQHRLTTIPEVEEHDDLQSPRTPRSKQRRFLKGTLQEVRIYLNQLPDTYMEQSRSSGNISISLSPPERRSSFKNRTSSLVGEVNESQLDNGESFLNENISACNRSLQMSQNDGEMLSFNGGQSSVSVSFSCPLASPLEAISYSGGSTVQYSECTAHNLNIPTPSTSRFSNSPNDSNSFKGFNLDGTNLQDKTLTPVTSANNADNSLNQSNYESPNVSKKNDTSLLKNITKRRNPREKRKVAQVMLKRLSLEKKRRSTSPIKKISEIINVPPITTSTEMKTRLRSSGDQKGNATRGDLKYESSPERKPNKSIVKTEEKTKKRKKDSPTKKAGNLKKEGLVKAKLLISSPKKCSPGRPKRAARPQTLKEPSLSKKMRRSK